MELGTSIFLSSIVLGVVALFVSTKDRWRWKRIIFGFIVWPTALLVVIGGGAWAYQWFNETFPPEPEKVTSYYQITLGMSKDEVLYLKNLPTQVLTDDSNPKSKWMRVIETDEIPSDKSVYDYNSWHYQTETYNPAITIEFDPNYATVISISCMKEKYGCEEVYGLGSGSSEQSVLKRLGTPSNATLEGVTKTLRYSDLNLKFHLTEGAVYSTFISLGGR